MEKKKAKLTISGNTKKTIDNIELAKNEMFLIQSFAKGDIQTSLNPSGFEWISTWLTNHSNKLIEVYFLYFCLLMLPLILFKYKIVL